MCKFSLVNFNVNHKRSLVKINVKIIKYFSISYSIAIVKLHIFRLNFKLFQTSNIEQNNAKMIIYTLFLFD